MAGPPAKGGFPWSRRLMAKPHGRMSAHMPKVGRSILHSSILKSCRVCAFGAWRKRWVLLDVWCLARCRTKDP
jgi:hypothetical protein